MSAILSANDLNDFISPGVACIKPIETLPKQKPDDHSNAYEVTTEDKVLDSQQSVGPAQISLTDCLACSGCVTSAEAVLISLQSHEEVLNTLNAHRSIALDEASNSQDGKIFVATVSPQTRASLAAMYGVSMQEAWNMIEQLLRGPQGLASGGRHGSGFTWVLDTNIFRDICQEACAGEALGTLSLPGTSNGVNSEGQKSATMVKPKTPILASACPGWICYAEKTHPHVLPHLSKLKSPQAMAGTLLKSVLYRKFGIDPEKVWHVAIMPCFDKKLEASREELTDIYWQRATASPSPTEQQRGVRDVDCVITARELLMLAESRGISIPSLPRTPVASRSPFPNSRLDNFLFQRHRIRQDQVSGTSGGYAHHILLTHQRRYPNSTIRVERGRNADVIDYSLVDTNGDLILKTARYYGFRNIQNLVRRLKPAQQTRMPLAVSKRVPRASDKSSAMSEYAYVEVMACPGGCTNGGGQIKAEDAASLLSPNDAVEEATKKAKVGPSEQKEWLARVDEAYYSSDESHHPSDGQNAEGLSAANVDCAIKVTEKGGGSQVTEILEYWSSITDIGLDKLLLTSYRQVESDVGKNKANGTSDMERVAGLASSIGGGW